MERPFRYVREDFFLARSFRNLGDLNDQLRNARYERRSLIVTASHPFGEWTSVFPDTAMTLAAVDRLVHHSSIFEMKVESYRRKAATARTVTLQLTVRLAPFVTTTALNREPQMPFSIKFAAILTSDWS